MVLRLPQCGLGGDGLCHWLSVIVSLMEAVKSKEHDSDGVAVTTVWAWW
jgi:hypothetical protein